MSKIVQLEIPFSFEEFKDIENYEGIYQISSYGRVYSVKRGKFLKPQSDKGYLQVRLYKNKKGKFYLIHRLVATAFIPNPLHLPQVNHINEIKTENHVENLEWCTASYNCNYGSRTARILSKTLAHPNWKKSREKCGTPKKAVLQFTLNGEFVKEYPSTCEASRQTKINQGNISQCCNGKYKSCGGYLWKYKNEEPFLY